MTVRRISCKGMDQTECIALQGPILFVCEKAGTLAMCINFRMLNKQIKIGVYLIPQINDILDWLCKDRVFSKIDLSIVYHQVAVELSNTYTTTFLTKYGLCEFLALPFG